MVYPSSNYHEPFLAGVLLNQKMTTRVLSMSSPCYIVTLPAQPFCMGYPEELCWTLFGIPTHVSTTQKVICSFELSLFSCLLTFVYQLIVKSMRAFFYRCLLLLWSVKPFYRGMIGETNSSTSSISRIGSKKLCSADQIANPAFGSVLPWSITIFISRMSWELHTILWTLGAVILLSIIIHFSVSVLL